MSANSKFWLALFAVIPIGLAKADPDPKDMPKNDSHCAVDSDCYPIGAALSISMDSAGIDPAHEYELRYQYRIHTKKGEEGPLLGTKDAPKGSAVALGRVQGGKGLSAKFDVTRGELSGRTNWPQLRDGESSRQVFLRVEPQVYDLTAKVFISPPKSNAVILVAWIEKDVKVVSLETLSKWFEHTQHAFMSDGAADIVKFTDLDAFNADGNNLGDVFYDLMREEKADEAKLIRWIEATPLDIGLSANGQSKSGQGALYFLRERGEKGSPLMKAAVKKKLDEMSKK